MINRLFARATSNITIPNSEHPFHFAKEQHLKFSADLDGQMLELERRHACKTCAPLIPQQRINTVEPIVECPVESVTYDDFGLVQGLQIDVSWM